VRRWQRLRRHRQLRDGESVGTGIGAGSKPSSAFGATARPWHRASTRRTSWPTPKPDPRSTPSLGRAGIWARIVPFAFLGAHSCAERNSPRPVSVDTTMVPVCVTDVAAGGEFGDTRSEAPDSALRAAFTRTLGATDVPARGRGGRHRTSEPNDSAESRLDPGTRPLRRHGWRPPVRLLSSARGRGPRSRQVTARGRVRAVSDQFAVCCRVRVRARSPCLERSS
jgi:hypothetical protein